MLLGKIYAHDLDMISLFLVGQKVSKFPQDLIQVYQICACIPNHLLVYLL